MIREDAVAFFLSVSKMLQNGRMRILRNKSCDCYSTQTCTPDVENEDPLVKEQMSKCICSVIFSAQVESAACTERPVSFLSQFHVSSRSQKEMDGTVQMSNLRRA